MAATAGETPSTAMAIANGERTAEPVGPMEVIPEDRWELLQHWFAELNVRQDKILAKFEMAISSFKGDLRVIGPRIDTLSAESSRLSERVEVLAGLVHRHGNVVSTIIDAVHELQSNAANPFVEAVDELRRVRGVMERALEAMDAQRALLPL